MRLACCMLFMGLLLSGAGCAGDDHSDRDLVDRRVLERKGWAVDGREHRALNADLNRILDTHEY